MPGYEGKFNANELDSLVKYLLSLSKDRLLVSECIRQEPVKNTNNVSPLTPNIYFGILTEKYLLASK